MTPEELIEAVSKMTGGEWEAHDRESSTRIFSSAHRNSIGSMDSYVPGFGPQPDERLANAAGLVALKNHAVRIIQSLISERDAALARVADTLCLDLQRKCVDIGVYWRAPDAHGVTLDIEQATDLLRDALGVEVEIRAAIDNTPNTRDAGPSPFSGRTTRREQ